MSRGKFSISPRPRGKLRLKLSPEERRNQAHRANVQALFDGLFLYYLAVAVRLCVIVACFVLVWYSMSSVYKLIF